MGARGVNSQCDWLMPSRSEWIEGALMIRVTVSYPARAGARFDHEYYASKHRPLIVDRLKSAGLIRIEIDKCVADGAGGAPGVVASAHMFFPSVAEFQAAMSKHGAELLGDIPNYTDIQPSILISAVVD